MMNSTTTLISRMKERKLYVPRPPKSGQASRNQPETTQHTEWQLPTDNYEDLSYDAEFEWFDEYIDSTMDDMYDSQC